MFEQRAKINDGLIPKKATVDQAKDTGMAMALICMLTGHFGHKPYLIVCAMLLLLVAMLRPALYKPLARVWFGLSNVLGAVMSRILLGILFFIMVMPIGMARRLSGKDSLQLNKWRKNNASVFTVRDHLFSSSDIQNPY